MSDAEIPPDTKDWTWVLDQPCPDCGFDAPTVSVPEVPDLVRGYADRWEVVLDRDDVGRRPAPQVWSPLEYACHVRDVFDVFAGRVRLMLAQDAPTFENWDQDAAAVEGRYAEQSTAVVRRELRTAAEDAAAAFGSAPETSWQRTGLRSNGSHFTVETLARYFVHDVVHHLHDVDA